MTLAFDDILAAQTRLKGHIEHTPCRHSRTLSEITGAEVWVKFENLQFTAAYKERCREIAREMFYIMSRVRPQAQGAAPASEP